MEEPLQDRKENMKFNSNQLIKFCKENKSLRNKNLLNLTTAEKIRIKINMDQSIN